MARPEPLTVKTINLALQGGGAHGAYTWGVLDALLADERIAIEGISATSAGAMNAAALAQGMMMGGREGARVALDRFWQAISAQSSPLMRVVQMTGRLFGGRADANPAFFALESMTRLFSPYELNPFDINPLRDVLSELIDFDMLRRCTAVRLFVSATNVRSGKIRVFETHEMSAAVLLASACLPQFFRAVEIEGEAYWDGGYMGNPAIFPLIYHCRSPDVIVVHINPIRRDDVPTTASAIMDRVNEVSFNSSLMREMRAIAFVTKLIDSGAVRDKSLKRVNMHSIESDDVMRKLGLSSKYDTDAGFLGELRAAGSASARNWLVAHYDGIGRESTVDIRAKYL